MTANKSGVMLHSILFTLIGFGIAQAFPTGAPAAACADIYPVGHATNADSQDLGSNPFRLNLSELDHSYGGSVYYVPARTYTVTLSGSGGEGFRGFLVQARTVADGSPVGMFTDNGNDQKLSSCTPAESAVTHTNREHKSSVTLSWTAPPDGSGQLHILFAIVSEFNVSIGSSIFWAPAVTDIILPCRPPLYLYQENCVETCPMKHIGNHTSGRCEPFPNDYIISLNATRYYTNLDSETPVETPAFHMELSINLGRVTLSDIDEIRFRFYQNALVQNLFEFENGTGMNTFIATDYVQSADGETAIVNATILLVTLPEAGDYPIEIDMTLSVLINVNSLSLVNTITAEAVGSIVLAPGACEFNTCLNGGTCTDTNSTYYVCDCPPQFTGETCSEPIDACYLFEPCINGTCNPINSTDYTCTCYSGYTGSNCSERICEEAVCSNGVCILNNDGNVSCDCDFGYTGRVCDKVISDCNQSECSGNGNCTEFNGDFYCECGPTWTGTQCETQIICDPNPCENGGNCSAFNDTGICTCTPGWTGPYCGTQLNICDSNPCSTYATCSKGCYPNVKCFNETGQEYSCLCMPGFTGDTCTEAIKFCQPDSCANSGTCIEENGPSVSCLCAPNFTGPTCDEDISIDGSCSQVINGQVIIILICAITTVTIVAMVGTFITIVLVARRMNPIHKPNGVNREMSGRVFFNTNVDTGIYFTSNGDRESGNRTLSTTCSRNGPTSELPTLPGCRESVSSQQNSDRLESATFENSTMSQLSTVSDYEEPVTSLRRYRQASHTQHPRLSSHYETVR